VHGGSPIPNRFVIAWRIPVQATLVQSFVSKFCDQTELGYAAWKAAKRAHDAIIWPTNHSFASRMNIFGDPAAKVKFVYDGDAEAVSTEWKRQ